MYIDCCRHVMDLLIGMTLSGSQSEDVSSENFSVQPGQELAEHV